MRIIALEYLLPNVTDKRCPIGTPTIEFNIYNNQYCYDNEYHPETYSCFYDKSRKAFIIKDHVGKEVIVHKGNLDERSFKELIDLFINYSKTYEDEEFSCINTNIGKTFLEFSLERML